jgi:hypothetical protein
VQSQVTECTWSCTATGTATFTAWDGFTGAATATGVERPTPTPTPLANPNHRGKLSGTGSDDGVRPVARDIVRAMDGGAKTVLYTPGIWAWVMRAIRAQPRFVMRKIRF